MMSLAPPEWYDLIRGGVILVIAVFASYVAFAFTAYARTPHKVSRLAWPAAALAMGCGIWAMHLVALLGLHPMAGEMRFASGPTILSLVYALAGTTAGFFVISRYGSAAAAVSGGIVMGLGVTTMQYTGIAALSIPFTISHEAHFTTLSVINKVGVAVAALWLALEIRGIGQRIAWACIIGAAFSLVQGIAVRTMMLQPLADAPRAASDTIGLPNVALALAGATFLVLFLGIAAVSIDVAERKRAQAELRESEERYRALVTASASIVWRSTPDGEVFDAVGWEDFTGEPVRTGLGRAWWDPVDPADREPAIAAWQAVRASGEPGEIRYRLRRRDGEYRWCVCRVAPLRSPDGSIREWVGTIVDIHAYRMAQEELARSEERYRLATRAVQGVVWDRDLSSGQIYWTEGVLEVFGYVLEQVNPAEAWWTDRIHPDDRERVVSGLTNAINGGAASWSAEYRFRRADGSHVQVFDRGFMMRDAEERPLRMVGAVQDSSERLRLEAQLRQSQKMETIGQLTGGIAHDFNNLLTVILGNAEVLTENPTDPALTYSLASQILQTAERGADLNQKLLTFGRRQSLKPEPLQIEQVVEDMLPLLYRTIGAHIELTTDLRPGTKLALTDRTLLESAILNLVVNARDAMPQGGALVIRTGERTAAYGEGSLPVGQPVVFVTIADTGTGMSADVVERAFEPFFTTKEVGKGSGLGLSMVFGFAQQSAGHVGVESRVGEGTAVTIVLPAVGAGADRLAEREVEAAEPQAATARVLIVEDEPQVLQFVSTQLTSLGYEVTEATNGRDALSLLENGLPCDLLFSDVMLPKGMSGVELAVRARELRPDLRVLLTSGYPEDVFEHHGRPQEGTLVLRKPYRRKELAETLQKVLESP